ncbi:Zinc finger protein [Plakobranchus ocellatus]|uniref:Zinc finger protein n=1 Tax=Plakobranchus ocellatus TaxID=259542 RepID=A0AAV4AZA5_9GAST|nr:Zinc finger protein [Plakobranchus ocellatus]
MQWKGPFDVLATVGANDYCIHVNRKEMIFHARLLKRYVTRDTASDETPPGDGCVLAASLAVVEDDDEGSSCNDCGCEVLSELGGCGRKESLKNLKFGDDLSAEQRHELEELA